MYTIETEIWLLFTAKIEWTFQPLWDKTYIKDRNWPFWTGTFHCIPVIDPVESCRNALSYQIRNVTVTQSIGDPANKEDMPFELSTGMAPGLKGPFRSLCTKLSTKSSTVFSLSPIQRFSRTTSCKITFLMNSYIFTGEWFLKHSPWNGL